MEVMFDAWWGKDDVEENKESIVETKSKKQSTQELEAEAKIVPAKDTQPTSKPLQRAGNRQFVSLPEVIPLRLRIELLRFIQSNLKQQLSGATELRRGFLADQIAVEIDEASGGFLGIGSQKQTTAVKFSRNSTLLSKFETLINRYEVDHADDTDQSLNYDQQIRALTEYVDEILEQEDKLHSWLTTVPSTYQPEAYIVDMRFSNNLERIVRLIYAIESSSKWLQVRDLQITIADKKETTISANLSMIARVL